MGWLRLVGSLKLQVSFVKEPYKRDLYSAKRRIILRSLLIVATPYIYSHIMPMTRRIIFRMSQCMRLVRERERKRERGCMCLVRERERKRERGCVCVCVHVCERERECVCVCVCVFVCVCMFWNVNVRKFDITLQIRLCVYFGTQFTNRQQRTATHSNTLQHIATHCNTLQHTATQDLQHDACCKCEARYCITLQHTATHCNTLQHIATYCNTLQDTATHCNTGFTS